MKFPHEMSSTTTNTHRSPLNMLKEIRHVI